MPAAFAVGDKVTPTDDQRVPAAFRGRTFTVVKVNPKNVRATADDGGRGINFPKDVLRHVEDGEAPTPSFGRPYVPPAEPFHEGAIVTLNREYKQWSTDDPFVVLRDNGKRLSVAPLGGANGQYVRVSKAGVTAHDREWLAERLLRA